MKDTLTIRINLLEAIYHLCTYNESKVLLAAMCYNKTPTSTQVGKLTGLDQPNNYFKVRKRLIDMNYLIIDDAGMHVNTDKILSDYANSSS